MGRNIKQEAELNVSKPTVAKAIEQCGLSDGLTRVGNRFELSDEQYADMIHNRVYIMLSEQSWIYDELTMPPELRKAHQANDKAVMEAYGFWGKLNTESECVAELMKMYQKLTK